VQRHPFRQQILHLDFQRVVAGQALQVTVPLHYLNEDTCYGVKTEGGMINKIDTEVTVSCRPRDIPESIEIDMAEMKIGDSVHLSDLVMAEGVELVDYDAEDDSTNRAIASVAASRATLEEDEAADDAAADGGDEAASEGDSKEESSD